MVEWSSNVGNEYKENMSKNIFQLEGKRMGVWVFEPIGNDVMDIYRKGVLYVQIDYG